MNTMKPRPASSPLESDTSQATVYKKSLCCTLLLFFSVSATLCTQASKSPDGSYPYNSYVIPFAVESLKLLASITAMVGLRVRGTYMCTNFSKLKFLAYCLPALCYFVSNNCMFFIIEELGPTNFQILNNLKVLSTGILMRIFLNRHLTWIRWKALILLMIGSMVSQLREGGVASHGTSRGYIFVVLNSFAAGAGGVISEKLLKGDSVKASEESIHLQNAQLYLFGTVFGLISLLSGSSLGISSSLNAFSGVNSWALATIVSLSICGVLVSYILKYLDNFAKCFVTAVSILLVALIDVAVSGGDLSLQMILGMSLTFMAIEQYNLPQ